MLEPNRGRGAICRALSYTQGAGCRRCRGGRHRWVWPAGGSVLRPSISTILARLRCPETSRTAERETLSHWAIAPITARLAAPSVGEVVTQASNVW